ncbi:hypothetical protein [Candidatus Viridilinea mediisalina]|uniref:hypothetical protein n=1 Tax=Candidatus Viridilinea mediisalina TaxID=2024553 RepID=UPI000F5B4056|nr:hypothetical protein [Candidatus Viridilinea mediisalina]
MRDDFLRWRTALDEAALQALIGTDSLRIEQSMQDWVMVHGFNGTSRLWRMPAAAIRRGSVFEVTGTGVAELARRAAQGEWLGERTHEGFGHFRLDEVLPGITSDPVGCDEPQAVEDDPTEVIAAQTRQWFDERKALAKPPKAMERKPSLSQWFDLVADLERGNTEAIRDRLNPTTAGAKSWGHADARAILEKLSNPAAYSASQRRHHLTCGKSPTASLRSPKHFLLLNPSGTTGRAVLAGYRVKSALNLRR